MKKEKNKLKKKNGYIFIISGVLLLITVLGLFASLFGGGSSGGGLILGGTSNSPGMNDTESLPENKILDVDENIKLYQNSHGAVYLKNTTNDYVSDEPVIYATNQANGDYVEIEFPDVSFDDFMESNFTQFKISFDLIGFESYAIPSMVIEPIYSENFKNIFIKSYTQTKISPTSASKYTVTSACYSSEAEIFPIADIPGIHKVEYIFKKVDIDEFSFTVSVDGISNTYVHVLPGYDFDIKSLKISISNNYTDKTAVRIANVSTGYVPTLAAFPGETIVIPTNSTVTYLGTKESPVYNVNKDQVNISLSYNSTIAVNTGIASDAYASIYLKNDCKSINIFDYDYLTIDYYISVVDGKSPYKCMAYLLGRPGGVKQYNQSNVWFSVDSNLDMIYALNNEKTHMSDVSNTIHVRYVIKTNRETQTADLQVFFNDVLYYDAPGTFDSVNNCIEEIRIKHFEGAGEMTFANLVFCGYTNT